MPETSYLNTQKAASPASQHSTFNIFSLMKRILYTAPSSTKAFFFLFFLAFSAGLSAQTQTASLSVQGVLTRSDGTAVDDGNDYVLTFRLWTAESGGTKVHEETIIDISIVGGVYSVVLGVGNTPLTAAFNQTYWLGVSVNTSSVELLPRPRLTHAPYALGLVGQNNVFPSTGTVIADAINIAGNANATAFKAGGGLPIGPNASNGYSFGAGGDADGGLFSDGDNNVGLYANATKALEANNSGVSIPGTLSVGGAATTGPHTVNGWQEVNGLQTINSNQIVNGFSTVTANQTVDGIVRSGDGIVNKAITNSGIFWSSGLADVLVRVNNEIRMNLGANGTNYYRGSQEFDLGAGDFYIGSPKAKGSGGNWKTLQINLNDGGNVRYDNSSRRFKRNIRPLVDDFSLILKAQPRVYNRLDDDTTYNELGYIAEEMDSIGLHKLVQYDQDGVVDGFDYDKMILYTVEVLKIQDAALKDLRAELEAMKAANNILINENKGLSAENSALTQQQANFSAQLESISKRILLLEGKDLGNSKK